MCFLRIVYRAENPVIHGLDEFDLPDSRIRGKADLIVLDGLRLIFHSNFEWARFSMVSM